MPLKECMLLHRRSKNMQIKKRVGFKKEKKDEEYKSVKEKER